MTNSAVVSDDDLLYVVRVFNSEDRTLLRIENDGTVTGAIEDVSEAGRLFVEAVRSHLEGHPLTRVEPSGMLTTTVPALEPVTRRPRWFRR